MHEVTPPGQRELDDTARHTLAELTAALVTARPDSTEEFLCYTGIRQRRLDLPLDHVRARLSGQTILVTGGSGCIGTVLCEQLTSLGAARLVSIGITPPERQVPGVEYVHLDIRDFAALEQLFDEVRPDIVFHLAAQRDPGLAEREVHRTISTNLLGTRYVIAAAERAGVKHLVHASTGKALRPYTKDVYAASKRASEWVVARGAARGILPCSIVRFTHVVDNSILLSRLEQWCRTGGVIRLHSAHAAFYAQSAIESAQLILCAALAPRDDLARIHTIQDLGWPVTVLGLALGLMARIDKIAPVYFAGYEPGYEETPYPGLFDPALAGSVSPLINAFEAHQVKPTASAMVDCFTNPALDDPRATDLLRRLERLCHESSPGEVLRLTLDDLSWALLDMSLQGTPLAALRRVVEFTGPYRDDMSEEHRQIDAAVQRWTVINGRPLAMAQARKPRLAQASPPHRHL